MPRGFASIKGKRNPCSQLVINNTEEGVVIKIKYPSDNLALIVDPEKLIEALAHQELIKDPRVDAIEDILNKVKRGIIKEHEFKIHVQDILYPEPPYIFPTDNGTTLMCRGKVSELTVRFTLVNKKWVNDMYDCFDEMYLRERFTDFKVVV